ncbi:hypothetical protein [Kitasatospora fiedleri]|uniref:hypothetical protein n=1 Tax=Kitasatospora fiedleri TaxID=2991545 RepID=UPI00249BC957|nr:hypothetical protein [Kitasatospora fiedleri]
MTAPALERPSAPYRYRRPRPRLRPRPRRYRCRGRTPTGPAPSRAPAGPVAPLPAVARAVTLAAVLLLGFAGYLFALSGLQEARHQSTAYATLRDRLANATAPTGPTRTARRWPSSTSRRSACARPWWSRAPPAAT